MAELGEMISALNGLGFAPAARGAASVARAKEGSVEEPTDGFTASQATEPARPSVVQHLMDVSSKSLVLGAGLTLMGVPAPISATIAVGHLVTQAAPETTGKILSNSATVVAVAAAGALTLGGALAAPIADLGGQFVRHGVGHGFLPGFSD